ncbi:MAG: SusD/RagB family nutrient-binding outer membrane lipoprotein [Saprospiraceae bacterium]
MKYLTNYSILALLSALLFAGCTKDFTELNTNPNAPVDVQPELLLRQVIFDYADGMSYEGFTGGSNLGQYFSADPGFNAFDRGNLLAPQFGGNPWPLLYTNLRDIQLVLDKSRSDASLAVYEGPALVLKSLIAANITDIFGDVPYTEAAQGANGIVNPSYDLQEDIYTGADGILANLKLAVEVMDAYTGAAQLNGDELYSGDLDAWIRFANSLSMRYLVRASGPYNSASIEFFNIVSVDGRFITEASEDAVYQFNSAPNDFRMARARSGDFTNYLMSSTIDTTLDAFNDPRQELWFRANANGAYSGERNGLAEGSLVSNPTVPGLVWRENSTALKANFMTSWETHFVLAEAASIGLIFDDPKTLYETGITQAFAYWDTELPADYLTRPGVEYDDLSQVATQRWLASIGNGYEGWIEWRRTGFPEFLAPVSSLNGGLIPVRFPYPTTEQALNEAAFNAAVQRIGGENSPNVKTWWAL